MNEINIHKLTKKDVDNKVLNSNFKKLSNKMSLEEVAQEFESIFVNQMLKSARSAKLSDGILTNEANKTYQSLLDQEYSKSLAKNHSFGIAEGLIRQFGSNTNRK